MSKLEERRIERRAYYGKTTCTRSHETTSSRAHERNERRMSSTPPMSKMHMHSTLELRKSGPFAQQVPIRSNYTQKPTMRMTNAREVVSTYFPRGMIHETRRVRPANF